MLCPKCQTKTQVLDSRNNGQHRRRECLNPACGHRFVTTEVIVAEKRRDAKKGEEYATKMPAEPEPMPPRKRTKPAPKPAIDPAFTTRESISAPTTEQTERPAFSFALRMPPGAAARLKQK